MATIALDVNSNDQMDGAADVSNKRDGARRGSTLSITLTGSHATDTGMNGFSTPSDESINQTEHEFVLAERFVSAVLSRIEKDPTSLSPHMWAFQQQENRLWALKQQATVGSCEGSRGSKEYNIVMSEQSQGILAQWFPVCCRMVGDSKIKLWQNLGDMSKIDAKLEYVALVTAIVPEWRNPLGSDSALLRTWTPDDDSSQCGICQETFTFLNRRHHCRRCLNLVCAVCSAHSLPLRVFTSTTTPKRQRICITCYRDILANPPPSASASAEEVQHAEPTEASTNNTDHPPEPQSYVLIKTERSPSLNTSLTIHMGMLDFFHGSGFRKNWHRYFFVLLIRKGSLGMFLSSTDHVERKKRPTAVYKLSGYTIRVKSQKRRPHQFLLSHATKKVLHFAASSIEEMNLWINNMMKAIDVADAMETVSPLNAENSSNGKHGSFKSGRESMTASSSDFGTSENDFTQDQFED